MYLDGPAEKALRIGLRAGPIPITTLEEIIRNIFDLLFETNGIANISQLSVLASTKIVDTVVLACTHNKIIQLIQTYNPPGKLV